MIRYSKVFSLHRFRSSIISVVLATITAMMACCLLASQAKAQSDRKQAGFDVAFSNCVESIAVGLLPTIDYDYLRCNGEGLLYVVVPQPGRLSLSLFGGVQESNTIVGSFEANWWFKSNNRLLKMNTKVPEIRIGTADLELTTRAQNPLGRLIGSSTLNFPILQQFNTFNQAQMRVGISAP